MSHFLLDRVRLSYYYPTLFVGYSTIILSVQHIQLTSGQLALFSVNSFLLAFYLAPIMSAQKTRVDELSKAIRNEAIAFFNIAIQSQQLSPATKREVKSSARSYLKMCVRSRKIAEGEKEYEKLLRFCIDFEGKKPDKETIRKIQDILIANQQNRSQLSVQLQSGVFAHEWFVLLVLASITVSYVVLIDFGGFPLLSIVAALLCTGLTLLLLILAKLNALTHKKAKLIWTPFDHLLETDFRHIDY